MNKKDECQIVRDLSYQFKEKSLSEGSAQFVKKHLQTCDECKQYYQSYNSQLNNKHDDIIIHQFKKIHRHINVLKISLISILIILLTIFLILFVRLKIFQNIVNSAYEKIEYMQQLDNYKVTVKTINKNLETGKSEEYEENYYYKDGNYKMEDYDSLKFYKDDSYEKILAYHSLKQITYYNQEFIEFKKGDLIKMFTDVINYKKISSSIYSLGFSIREERYNGIDCYVIKNGSSDSYRETWINKDNFITIRVINESYNNFYREVIYDFTENIVTDDDVDISILDSDMFKEYERKTVVNHATDEDKSFYEIYRKE